MQMSVLSLDHINLRTPDPQRTLSFFRDVLQMKVGLSPGLSSIEEGGWVYDDRDLAIIHVGSVKTEYPTDSSIPFKSTEGSGAVHHIALQCSGFEVTKSRLAERSIQFTETNYPHIDLRQIFITESNGVLLELNFTGAASG